MKKTVLMFATAALAALSLSAVAGNKVSAATTDGTTAKITLTPDKTVGDKSGELQLVQAPDFNFKDTAIDSSADTTSTTDGSVDIQVINPGIAEGWHLTAKADEFTGTTGKLAGATLALTTATDSKTEANGESDVNISDADAKVFSADFALLASGKGYAGVGTSNSAASAKLTVPAGNVAGTYSAKINWTLTADPTTPATPANTNTSADGE